MMKKALIVIDHGSRLKAANDMIFDVVDKLRTQKPDIIIEGCHMELADPDIATTIDLCVNQGATHIIAQPFMLSPGRHSTSDIPNLVQEAATKHPSVKIEVKPHFGLHDAMSNVIFDSAGL